MNGHNVVGFKVRVRQLDQRVDVVLVGVHLVLVDGPDVPGAAVSQGERPHTQRAFVGFDAGVSLPVSPGEEREGISWRLAVSKSRSQRIFNIGGCDNYLKTVPLKSHILTHSITQ